MIADLKLTKKTGLYGLFGRRYSTRNNFKINDKRPLEFYSSNSTVEVADSARMRSDEYWARIRHEPLAKQEEGITDMLDSLNEIKFFKIIDGML